MKVKDGDTFGRWSVIVSHPISRDKRARCRCECGEVRLVERPRLKSGKSKSCGCLRNESVSARQRTHGMGHSNIYKVWNRMVSRCRNESDHKFPNYGGRGIKVCDEWANSFETFFAYMGMPPFEGASIDREDNDGNYEPGNVKWSTRREQAFNKTTTRHETFNGVADTLAAHCESSGISEKTVRSRLALGWSLERALQTPVDRRYVVGNHRGARSA